MKDPGFPTPWDDAPAPELAGSDEFERYLRAALRDFGPVPEPPREAMWARIDAARRGRRGTASRAGFGGRAGTALAVVLAATLALGFGIGRGSLVLRPPAAARVAVDADAGAASDATLPFRVAAVHHLTRTEALLTSLPASSATGATGAAGAAGAEEVAAWAAELLVQTRLLLDSPAGDDPELGRLLTDLELLLAQVAALTGGRAADELELIRDGMDHTDVMLRLRTATMVRPFAGT